MRIQCAMHADFETPGEIQAWANERGHELRVVRPYLGEEFERAEAADAFISMGGPQSSIDHERYEYLVKEIEHLKSLLVRDVPALGFCLGAQLIGLALGADPARSPEREFGIFPVRLTDAGKADPVLGEFDDSFDVIHWHSDMPGMTSESEVLAASEGCPRQAVRYRENVYGLQFHMEITKSGLRQLVGCAPRDLANGKFVQGIDELLASKPEPINRNAWRVLDNWLRAGTD